MKPVMLADHERAIRIAMARGHELKIEIDHDAQVVQCKSCHASVWWGSTRSGAQCPFDVLEGRHTRVSHFATCPDARRWSKR